MKKLIALLALVCVVLMPFSVMAEEKTAIDWAASETLIADTDLTGDFYNIEEMGLKIWLPDELNAVEVTEEETASGVYAKLTDEEQTCVLTIYALHVDGITLDQAYQNAVNGGMKEPESFTALSTWTALVIGIIPGMTGTVTPASRSLYMKLKKRLLSNTICVVRKSAPASTFSLR